MFVDRYSFGYFIGNEIGNIGFKILNIITTSMIGLSVIATIFSGWDYIKSGKELFKD